MQKLDMAEKLVECIEEMTANVDAVQERVLAEILRPQRRRRVPSEMRPRRRRRRPRHLPGQGARGDVRGPEAVHPARRHRRHVSRPDGPRPPDLRAGGEPKLIPAVKDELDRRILLHSLVTAVMNQ
jgi:auxin responsive GH3 family protein